MSLSNKKAQELIEQAIKEHRESGHPGAMMSLAESMYSPQVAEWEGILKGLERALLILEIEQLPPKQEIGRGRIWNRLTLQLIGEEDGT